MLELLIKFYFDNIVIFNILILLGLIVSVICYILYKEKIKRMYNKYKELINYFIIGVLTTVVSIGSYWLFRFIISNYIILSVISWILAVSFAYITNRIFVFESKEKNVVSEISKFVSCRLLTLGLEVVFMMLFVSILNINDMIAKIILQFVVLVSNYLLSKLFVFNKKII